MSKTCMPTQICSMHVECTYLTERAGSNKMNNDMESTHVGHAAPPTH